MNGCGRHLLALIRPAPRTLAPFTLHHEPPDIGTHFPSYSALIHANLIHANLSHAKRIGY